MKISLYETAVPDTKIVLFLQQCAVSSKGSRCGGREIEE
jgi:hypothetical protein